MCKAILEIKQEGRAESRAEGEARGVERGAALVLPQCPTLSSSCQSKNHRRHKSSKASATRAFVAPYTRLSLLVKDSAN